MKKNSKGKGSRTNNQKAKSAKAKSKGSEKSRFSNARYNAPSGAGGCEDRSREFRPAPPMNQRALDYIASDLYFTDWQAAKIINIPVEDMLRYGWEYDNLDKEKTKQLTAVDKKLDILSKVKKAMIIERLLGGAVILMGIKGEEDKPEAPVNLNSISEGDLTFLNVIPRHRVHLRTVDNDPLSAGFGRPLTYTINGKPVHESRLLIFDGNPLSYVGDDFITPRRSNYQIGFGQSKLLRIIDDLARATGTRQAAFHLVNMASVLIANGDMTTLGGTEEGEEKLSDLQRIYQEISVYKIAMLDNKGPGADNTQISQLSASFGSVPELVMTYLQVLSAAGDVPATRFLGQAPGGLNATGESDLENYYGRLESEQTQTLKPQLEKYTAVASRSAGVEEPEISFDPLWTTSEKERAEIRQIDGANIVNLNLNGVITDEEARDEAIEKGILTKKEMEENADILAELNRVLAEPESIPV